MGCVYPQGKHMWCTFAQFRTVKKAVPSVNGEGPTLVTVKSGFRIAIQATSKVLISYNVIPLGIFSGIE